MSEFKTVQELKQFDPLKAEPFRSILVLRRKSVKTAKNGNPFISLEMGDAGGSFTANAFGGSAVFSALEHVEEGAIIRIAGKTEYYQERFSPRLQAAEEIDAAEAEASGVLEQLVETPPESEEETIKRIENASRCKRITNTTFITTKRKR